MLTSTWQSMTDCRSMSLDCSVMSADSCFLAATLTDSSIASVNWLASAYTCRLNHWIDRDKSAQRLLRGVSTNVPHIWSTDFTFWMTRRKMMDCVGGGHQTADLGCVWLFYCRSRSVSASLAYTAYRLYARSVCDTFWIIRRQMVDYGSEDRYTADLGCVWLYWCTSKSVGACLVYGL